MPDAATILRDYLTDPGEDAAGLELVLINLIIATIGAIVLIAGRRAITR